MIDEEEYQETSGTAIPKVFAAVVFAAQFIASAILCVKAFLLGMIPDKYLYGIAIALWLLLMISALLLFVGISHAGNLTGIPKNKSKEQSDFEATPKMPPI